MGGGRNKRGRTQRRHFRDGRENVWKKPRAEVESQAAAEHNEQPQGPSGGAWVAFVTENTVFEQYYKKQGILAEGEWEDFLTTLRKPLPAVFRINASGQFATEIKNQIEQDFVESLKNQGDDESEDLIKALPWYPGKLAWHLSFSRMQLRKNQALARIHDFLKRENEIGNITRQEAVSMLPPLFLDVHPNHRVLDMCAAPGSKTFQLLEMIHSEDKDGSLPTGVVIANDLDVQRCHLLIHQTKRMCSPNLIVTNHEAQHFPGLRDRSIHTQNEERSLLFDRVLCDVPCSGDGTIRKAPDMWKKWNVGMANGIHQLQVQIAMRGVALLKVGGRLVYSTCSLNPVEDEAVVGEILRRTNGCLELLDVSGELPELKRRPGLKTWKVRDKGFWISSYKYVNKHRAGSVVPGMFPTGNSCSESDAENVLDAKDGTSSTKVDNQDNITKNDVVVNDEPEYSTLPLERCMRIFPHDQDTGGFFIAVFKKVSEYKVEQEHVKKSSYLKEHRHSVSGVSEVKEKDEQLSADNKEEDKKEDGIESEENKASLVGEGEVPKADISESNGKQQDKQKDRVVADVKKKVQQQGRWKGVDPVLFLKDENLIQSIIDFYGIKDTLPLHGHLITRSEDTSRMKRIYYVSDSVANVMNMNFRVGEQMKITSVGLKVFERQGGKEGFSPCAFRTTSEGLPFLLPHITKQIVHACKEDFKLLLLAKTTTFTSFSDPSFSAAVTSLLPGCCIVMLKDGQSEVQIKRSMVVAIGCWRGRNNMSLLIPSEEAHQLLERLFPGEEHGADENGTSEKEVENEAGEKHISEKGDSGANAVEDEGDAENKSY